MYSPATGIPSIGRAGLCFGPCNYQNPCLQGNVPDALHNELLTASATEGTLRKSWDFTMSPWKKQETS